MLDRLHATIAAVCPIYSVEENSYQPTEAATPQQIAAADAALAAFDRSQAAHDAWLEDQKPERKQLREQATQAVTDNQTYLALASPNNAQVVAQVRRLTQQNNHVIRRLVQID